MDRCEAVRRVAAPTSKGYAADQIIVSKSKQEGGNSEDLWADPGERSGLDGLPARRQDHWPGWEDSAVPPDRVGDYVRDLKALYDEVRADRSDVRPLRPGLHPLPDQLRPAHRRRASRNYRAFLEEAADLVASLRRVAVRRARRRPAARRAARRSSTGRELMQAMREFKAIWDPDWKMNPGKVVDAVPLRREPQARHRLQPARARTSGSPTPRTAATSPTPRCAASASASAASPSRRRRCAPATR